jgi:diacylglycerol kinase (ATP)
MVDSFTRALLIINPKSGHGGVDLSDALTVLRANGWDVTVRQKLHGDMAKELAHEAANQGFNVIVDCGGDGTLSEIVNGVAGADVAIGTLPGGTANVWAHEMGISEKLPQAAMQLVTATRRRVDVGHVDVNGKHGTYFLLMAGLGIDAAVMARVNKKLKNRIGKWAVGVAAIGALPDVMVAPVDVELDGAHWHGKISQIVIGNTRRYAGEASMTPDAYANDGQLDVCLITATTPLFGIRQLASLAFRGKVSQAAAEIYRAANIVVRSPVVFPLETDGGVFEPAMLWTRAPLTPLKPAAHQKALESANSNGTGEHLRKEAKWLKQRYQVISIGGDTFTAAREKDGQVVKVVITPETKLKAGSDGKKQPLWGQLTALSAEDIVRIKGVKGSTKRSIIAYRVKCEAPAALRSLQAG